MPVFVSCIKEGALQEAFDNIFNRYQHTPVSAEINGVLYFHEGYRIHDKGGVDQYWMRYPEVDQEFYLYRRLYCDENMASIRLRLKTDTIKVNIPYKCACSLGDLETDNGYIEFSRLDTLKAVGCFEFTVEDSQTGEKIEVSNGKFDIFV